MEMYFLAKCSKCGKKLILTHNENVVEMAKV